MVSNIFVGAGTLTARRVTPQDKSRYNIRKLLINFRSGNITASQAVKKMFLQSICAKRMQRHVAGTPWAPSPTKQSEPIKCRVVTW